MWTTVVGRLHLGNGNHKDGSGLYRRRAREFEDENIGYEE